MSISARAPFAAIAAAAALLGAALAPAADAPAPTPAPVPAPAPQRPDILHYDLRVTPDHAAGRLQVRANLVVTGLAPDRPLELGLADWYEDVRVRAGASPVRVERSPGAIAVTVERPGPVDTVTFTLAGAAGRSSDEERNVLGAEDLFLLWSDRWYPIAYDDWATVRTEIDLPAGWQAIAPGRLLRTRGSGKVQTQVWATSIPTRTFSVFADARWIRAEREIDGVTMLTLLHPGSDEHREKILAGSADVLAFYRDLHGDYPFDQFAFVSLEGIYARRAFPGWVGYSPRYLDQEMERTGHDAHETALLWWGYTSGGSGPGAWQWTEGLGDYVEILYDEARGLPVPANFERFRADYLATPTAEEPAITDLRGRTPQKFVHGKYPWVMGVLRHVVGDEPFRAAIRHLFRQYRHRTFTLDEFVAALSAGAGQDLAWWRTEWLERKGVPELAVEWRAEPRGGAWRLSGRVLQLGAVYNLPLEIAIETAAGRTAERVLLAGPEARFEFDLAQQPQAVIVDPARRLLLRLAAPPKAP